MKSRYAESFLFPNSQEDFRRPETFYPHQGLHGLDAVAPGYFEKYPDTKKSFEDQLAFYEKYLIDLKNTLANPGPYDTQSFTQSLIFDAETQIAYYKEQLRVENSLPNFQDTISKYVNDINAKAEAADAAARQASFFQSAADLYNEQGLVDAALQNQQMADDYARVAAEQQKMYAAAQASALDNIQRLSFTDYGLNTAAIRSAAEAAGAAAFFADPDVQRSLTKPAVVTTQTALVQPSTQTIQNTQRSLKMRNLSDIDIMVLDVQNGQPALIVAWPDGSYEYVAIGNQIDPWLTSHGFTRANVIENPAYTNLLATQTAEVDTSTKKLLHRDNTTGTVSTGDTTTGVVAVTTPTGETVTGVGTVTAGGVTTVANRVTNTVTTTNNKTGVTTITNPTTGSTVQTVTAAAGGTGNIALFGLLGLLLLRGALK